MGKLVAIVGNSGVGKTTLARALCVRGQFSCGLEQHVERPFQALFAADQQYALANQVDYLLYRAEQEFEIRSGSAVGVVDGGLDEDFFVFTRLFYRRGYLSKAGFDLCQRVYQMARHLLPPPDLLVWLVAPVEVIASRYADRGRSLEITQAADLQEIDLLLTEWRSQQPSLPGLVIDACAEDKTYARAIDLILARVEKLR